MRLGKDVGGAVHAPGLRRDDGARGQVVARELGAARGDDAREARGRGRVHAQRLLDDLVHVGQRFDVVIGEAVGQCGQLGQEAGLDVRVPAYQPDEICQSVGLRILGLASHTASSVLLLCRQILTVVSEPAMM